MAIRGWEGSGSPLVEKSVRDGHKSNLRVFVHMVKIWNASGNSWVIPCLESESNEDAAVKGACVRVRRGPSNYSVYFEKCKTWVQIAFFCVLNQLNIKPAHQICEPKTLIMAWKHSDDCLQWTVVRNRWHTSTYINANLTELQVTRFNTTSAFCLKKIIVLLAESILCSPSARCRYLPLRGGCTAVAESCSALPCLPSRRKGVC